jgi:hypothetical protein
VKPYQRISHKEGNIYSMRKKGMKKRSTAISEDGKPFLTDIKE